MSNDTLILVFAGISALGDFLGILRLLGFLGGKEDKEVEPQVAQRNKKLVFAVAFLFVVTVGLIGRGLYRIHVLETGPFQFETKDIEHMKYVHDKHFFREEVILDGTHFESCTLNDVTLTYNGTGGVAFSQATFSNIRFKNTSDSIGTAVQLMAAFGFFKPGVPLEGPDGQPLKPMPGAKHVGESH